MIIDPHVHSSGVSLCSRITCEGIIDCKKAAGFNGAVLTNHCQSWYFEPKNQNEWTERLIKEWENGALYAEKNDFKLLFGVEVTISDPIFSDWLLYGVTREFVRKCPCLYLLNQEQLFALCEQNDVFLVQAHPLRHSTVPAISKYMNGIEINCNPLDYPKKNSVIEFAKRNKLLLTCGTDYHSSENVFKGGMVVPDEIETAEDFAKYLFAAQKTTLILDGEQKTFITK